jgi:hypothetical protein
LLPLCALLTIRVNIASESRRVAAKKKKSTESRGNMTSFQPGLAEQGRPFTSLRAFPAASRRAAPPPHSIGVAFEPAGAATGVRHHEWLYDGGGGQ